MKTSLEKPDETILKAWRKNTANYRCWGMLYYNKEDKRLLVNTFKEENFVSGRRIGWDINFANPYSIVVTLILLALLIAAIIYI